jgi:hypothetical protein
MSSSIWLESELTAKAAIQPCLRLCKHGSVPPEARRPAGAVSSVLRDHLDRGATRIGLCRLTPRRYQQCFGSDIRREQDTVCYLGCRVAVDLCSDRRLIRRLRQHRRRPTAARPRSMSRLSLLSTAPRWCRRRGAFHAEEDCTRNRGSSTHRCWRRGRTAAPRGRSFRGIQMRE